MTISSLGSAEDPLADAWTSAPPVAGMHAALAARGLEARVVSPRDRDAYGPWVQAASRGFLDDERTDAQIEAARERASYRRLTGVYDPSGPMPEVPVATIASSVARLSVPGSREIPTCAISAVTVSPTHRRRGIARAMLEGELRAAVDAGIPMATLTVSESTIYGRYGFAPAAASASWRLDTKRATWIGPVPAGRVDFVPRERARILVAELHERVRPRIAGEVGVPGAIWDSFAGTRPDAKDPGRIRAVQYADPAGAVQGLALYTVRENHDDFTKSSARVVYLVAATDDAYAALWRFFVELDLVAEVRADELALDEPLRWMISDQRAATVTVSDHHYLRILDVPTALAARRYAAAGTIAIEVEDRLGIAGGAYVLEASPDGSARVGNASGAEHGALPLRLGIEELSAIHLGGVSVATLAAAGRIRCPDVESASRVFGWHVQPRLSFWY